MPTGPGRRTPHLAETRRTVRVSLVLIAFENEPAFIMFSAFLIGYSSAWTIESKYTALLLLVVKAITECLVAVAFPK
jgi:hypothetical protein